MPFCYCIVITCNFYYTQKLIMVMDVRLAVTPIGVLVVR